MREPDVFDIPSPFLQAQQFDAYADLDELLVAFNAWLDSECPAVDIAFATQPLKASHVMYHLDREGYDMTFTEWSQDFIPLSDGGYLHESCRMEAAAAWSDRAVELRHQ